MNNIQSEAFASISIASAVRESSLQDHIHVEHLRIYFHHILCVDILVLRAQQPVEAAHIGDHQL